MNENFNPVNSNNHITEIPDRTEKPKKTKKEKARIPFGAFAVMLVICIVVSMFSGAGSSIFMFRLINSTVVTGQEKEQDEFVIEESTQFVSSDIENETLPVPTENEEPETFLPTEPEESFTPEATEAPVTSPPALTKGEIYARAVDSIFLIKAEWKLYYDSLFGSYYRPATSSGTGFAIGTDGYIITNHHVIENAETLTVIDYNGKEYEAEIIGSEPSNDVAVIKINAPTKAVLLGDSSSLTVGDDIMVIGNALGELSYTFTDGIVSHLSRMVKVESGETINMFQTNAAINNGNSGGPVYNMDGEVVGIASAKYASESIEGLGFCIPIDDVKSMIADIIIYGYVKGKPSLGVTLQTVTSSMSSRYSIPTGCYVVAIETSSGAYTAGLRQGDVITKINGETISSCEDMKAFLSGKNAGESISVTYTSSGTSKKITVSLDEYVPSEPRTNYSNVYDF